MENMGRNSVASCDGAIQTKLLALENELKDRIFDYKQLIDELSNFKKRLIGDPELVMKATAEVKIPCPYDYTVLGVYGELRMVNDNFIDLNSNFNRLMEELKEIV